MNIQTFSPQYVRTVTLCTHVSTSCNLKCKYCFKRVNGELSFSDVQRFIDCVLQIYPNAERYIVDMSGASEPLLNKDLLFKITDYCKKLSDKYLREFLPTFVTNGTLLTEQVVEQLQSNGVIFGISLDGTKEIHNKNRIFPNGKGSYEIVEENLSKIVHKKYVGAAVTYTDGNLLQSFLNAFNLVPTVSMKPVRYTQENVIDAKAVCSGYDELVDFLLQQTLNNHTEYLYAIVNGDDYFGKFLKRVVLNINVYGRCDAGIGRFALAGDKRIYCCPAAEGMEIGCVGDLDYGIRLSKIQKMWEGLYNEKCENCIAHDCCGGECKIVSYNRYGHFNGVDPTMCEIKQHVYRLASSFVKQLERDSPKMLNWLCSTCNHVDSYDRHDEELVNAVKLSKGKYTFTEMKKIKDDNFNQFKALYKELLKTEL